MQIGGWKRFMGLDMCSIWACVKAGLGMHKIELSAGSLE